ncbi:hypothetical protein VWN47_10770, partial [Campylobacter jejuni]
MLCGKFSFKYSKSSFLFSFVLPKFKNIIESNEIKKERKMEFLDSFFDIKNSSFQNFLRL